MGYQNTINLPGNTRNQPTKFRTKNWGEINDEERERITPIVKLSLKIHC